MVTVVVIDAVVLAYYVWGYPAQAVLLVRVIELWVFLPDYLFQFLLTQMAKPWLSLLFKGNLILGLIVGLGKLIN